MLPSLKGEAWPWTGCKNPEEGGPALGEEVSKWIWGNLALLGITKPEGGTQHVLGAFSSKGKHSSVLGVHLKGR